MRPPSISGWLSSSAALAGFMEPPYWMVTACGRSGRRTGWRMVARMMAADLAGLLGGGGLAGADGPDGLIGDDARCAACRRARRPGRPSPDRAISSMVMPSSRCSRLSPTQMMGFRPASRAAWTFLLTVIVGLAEVLAALAVADDDVLHAQILQHVGGDLAGVGAGLLIVARSAAPTEIRSVLERP